MWPSRRSISAPTRSDSEGSRWRSPPRRPVRRARSCATSLPRARARHRSSWSLPSSTMARSICSVLTLRRIRSSSPSSRQSVSFSRCSPSRMFWPQPSASPVSARRVTRRVSRGSPTAGCSRPTTSEQRPEALRLGGPRQRGTPTARPAQEAAHRGARLRGSDWPQRHASALDRRSPTTCGRGPSLRL